MRVVLCVLALALVAACAAAAQGESMGDLEYPPGDGAPDAAGPEEFALPHWSRARLSWECSSLSGCAAQPDVAEAKAEKTVADLEAKEVAQKADMATTMGELRRAKAAAGMHKARVARPSSKAGGIHARVTVTDMGEGDSQGFGASNNKIDLDTDFSCPNASSSTDDWIESITVNTIENGDNGEDYLSSGESYDPVHFTIQQGSNRRRTTIGYGDGRRRSAKIYYEGSASKKISNNLYFPSTLSPMTDLPGPDGRNNPDDYFNGKLLQEERKKPLVDGEKTAWYKINSGECYAMAAYIETKVVRPERFMEGSDDNFLKQVHLRVLKFAVCREGDDGEPLCASKKNIVSCWFKTTDDDWIRCEDSGDAVMTSAILARA